MISRRAIRLLAELYRNVFSDTYRSRVKKGMNYSYEYKYKFLVDSFHDFLYDRNYPAWFLTAIKRIYQFDERSVLEFIMGLETGNFIDLINARMNDQQYQETTRAGKKLVNKLTLDILVYLDDETAVRNDTQYELHKKLLHQLELDGFVYKNNQLFLAESNVINEKEETGAIHQLVRELQLNNQDIIFHHLSLTEEDYLEEKWDDSIGNSRKFLEAVLREIADKNSILYSGVSLPEETKSWAGKVRKYLAEENIFTESEMNAIKEVYFLMSETGNHPYIAAKDQAILMRNLSMSLTYFALLRYLGWVMKEI